MIGPVEMGALLKKIRLSKNLTLKELAPVRLIKNKFYHDVQDLYKKCPSNQCGQTGYLLNSILRTNSAAFLLPLLAHG